VPLVPDDVVTQQPPRTGDSAVDAALASLAEILARPLDARPAGFESLHRALTDRLADAEG
jgi:hypothetical protein